MILYNPFLVIFFAALIDATANENEIRILVRHAVLHKRFCNLALFDLLITNILSKIVRTEKGRKWPKVWLQLVRNPKPQPYINETLPSN